MSATNANFIIESYVIHMSILTKKESWYYCGYIDHGNTMVLSLTFSQRKIQCVHICIIPCLKYHV